MSRRRTAGLVLFAILFVGCQGPVTSLSGSVTWNGQPLDSGSISFSPTDGHGESKVTSIANGQYEIRDVPPGKYVAQIEAMVGNRVQAIQAHGNLVAIEVVPGPQTQDFTLHSQ